MPNAPIDAYYKAGWAFNVTGRTVQAERALTYTKQNLLQPDGDFQPRVNPWFLNIHYEYANAWVVIGAQKQGRYEISMPALKFLLSQQDSHGGIYSTRAKPGERKRTDTMSTGISGIAFLTTGQLDAARKVGDYFQWIASIQPEPQSRFYVNVEPDGRVLSQFPADESFSRVIDTKQKDQNWYAVGLPFVFSTLLYHATGEKRYWETAKWYFDFMSRCVNPWEGDSSGKAGWGCSVLYRVTGEKQYKDIALRAASGIINSQLPDGSFFWRGAGQSEGYDAVARTQEEMQRKLKNDDFDIAAEFTVWLNLIGTNILARDAI